MQWMCNFTYRHYFDVLEFLKKTHEIGPMNKFFEFKQKEKFVLLRHDIDYSLTYALDLAKLETKHKIKSTYFILLHSQYYNALSSINSKIIQKISNLGHEIGLHFDSDFLTIGKTKSLQELKDESKILSRLIGKQIKSFAPHNPSINTLKNFNFIKKNFINPYAQEIIDSCTYLSDSSQNWRNGCMCRYIEKINKIQILTHPIWWNTNQKTRNQNLIKLQKNSLKKFDHEIHKTKKIHKKYFSLLNRKIHKN